jgi:hypothetical protein
MSISYPIDSYKYQFTPWTEPASGVEWIFDASTNTWSRFDAPPILTGVMPEALAVLPVSSSVSLVIGTPSPIDVVCKFTNSWVNGRPYFTQDGTNVVPSVGDFHVFEYQNSTNEWKWIQYVDGVPQNFAAANSIADDYPWEAVWSSLGGFSFTVTEVPSTSGVLGQTSVYKNPTTGVSREFRCVSAAPIYWIETITEIPEPPAEITSYEDHIETLPDYPVELAAVSTPSVLNFGTIYRVALIGDSITASTSGVQEYAGKGFNQLGWGATLRGAARGMIELVYNSVEDSWDFALSSRATANFLVGGSDRATFDALLASNADTVIYALGVNDIGSASYDPAVTKANMLSQWGEIENAEMKLVLMGVFSSATTHHIGYLQKVHSLNAWMKYQAEIRGALFIDPTEICDDNRDGYSDLHTMGDSIHPNLVGATRIGQLVYRKLSPYMSTSNLFVFPASGSASWISPNPYASGTVGSNQTAANWWTSAVGSAVHAKNLVARDAGLGNWQEFVITGSREANPGLLANPPADYVQAYQYNNTVSVSAGDTFYAVCEVQPMTDTFYNIELMMSVNTAGYILPGQSLAGYGTRRLDHYYSGGLAACQPGKYVAMGYTLLRTPELTLPDTYSPHDLRAYVYIRGNGTVRLGRMSVIKV